MVREIKPDATIGELSGGVVCDGLGASFAAFFVYNRKKRTEEKENLKVMQESTDAGDS